MAMTKQVVRIGPFKDFIASGVRVGDTLTLSGQVSLDNDGAVVGAGDFAAQLEQVYANIQEVLGEFGASVDNIVDEMWLVTDIQEVMGGFERLLPIRQKVFGASYDVTQTMVEVSALAMPELMLEIKCIARL